MKEKTEREALIELTALCSRSEHCEHEMLEKMQRWNIADEAQARIMKVLTDNKFIDNERYARAFANDKIRYNKWGRRKVDQALWAKRIGEDIRRRVLEEIDDEEYLQVLRPLIKAKYKSTSGRSNYERKMKVVKFAMGRGFDYELIRRCIDVDDEDTDYGDD